MSSTIAAGFHSPLGRWIRSDDQNDIAVRLAATYISVNRGRGSYEHGRSTAVHQPLVGSGSGRAASPALSSTATDNVPPLNIPTLTSDLSRSSLSDGPTTPNPSTVFGELSRLEPVGGVLQLPSVPRAPARLICPFAILNCQKTLSDVEHWKTHVLSHFRGQYPSEADCFHCGVTFYDQSHGGLPNQPWTTMLTHMVDAHFRQDEQMVVRSRTLYKLMKFFFSRRIIAAPQFRHFQNISEHVLVLGPPDDGSAPPEAPMPPSSPIPTSTSASSDDGHNEQNLFTVQSSARRERRRNDRLRST